MPSFETTDPKSFEGMHKAGVEYTGSINTANIPEEKIDPSVEKVKKLQEKIANMPGSFAIKKSLLSLNLNKLADLDRMLDLKGYETEWLLKIATDVPDDIAGAIEVIAENGEPKKVSKAKELIFSVLEE